MHRWEWLYLKWNLFLLLTTVLYSAARFPKENYPQPSLLSFSLVDLFICGHEKESLHDAAYSSVKIRIENVDCQNSRMKRNITVTSLFTISSCSLQPFLYFRYVFSTSIVILIKWNWKLKEASYNKHTTMSKNVNPSFSTKQCCFDWKGSCLNENTRSSIPPILALIIIVVAFREAVLHVCNIAVNSKLYLKATTQWHN